MVIWCMITDDDLVIALSKSGETDEILRLISYLKKGQLKLFQ